MRLDKYIASTGILTRSECKNEIRKGLIKVNNIVVKDPTYQIDEENSIVSYKNQIIQYKRFTYVMLNKPKGYITSTDDPKEKTIFELLPLELKRLDLFPCGRLDKDTTGLILLTNNGELAHKLLSPKYHVSKTYFFTCKPSINDFDILKLENGISIGENIITKPAKITSLNKDYNCGYITITEGKFHQIKRMFNAVNSNIITLKRTSFANLQLDTLNEGEFRFLTNDEETGLIKSANL